MAKNVENEKFYNDVINLVIEKQTATVSMIQRHFRIGYTAASRIMDKLEADGIVGKYNGSKPREVLVKEPRKNMAKKKPAKPKEKKPPKKKSEKQSPGRKNWWTMLDMPSKLEAIEGWARQGSTNQEIAEMLNISLQLFYKWQREYPEFADAIKRGKFESNGELLNAAFKQATGYEVVEQTREIVSLPESEWYTDDNGNLITSRLEVTKTVTKHVHPNAATLIFMLKNRLPEYYRDKIEHEHTGDVGIAFIDDIPEDPKADDEG